MSSGMIMPWETKMRWLPDQVREEEEELVMDEGGIAWSIVEWRCIRSSIEFSNEAPHEEAKSEAPHEEAVQSLKEAPGALSVGMVKKKKKKKKREEDSQPILVRFEIFLV